ncbi:MAG: homocysteine S-methyltransferase [Gemmatimonadales bacterium]
MLDRFPDTGKVLVLDGGLATELEARGADLRHPLWSTRALLEQPDLVTAVHEAFLDAGADVLTTATYQTTFQGMADLGLPVARAERLLLEGVALARRAWGRRVERLEAAAERARSEGVTVVEAPAAPLVAASMGSYGAYRHDGGEYVGRYGRTDRELRAFHRDRVAVLASSDADLLAIETIPSRQEAEVLVDLLEEQGRASAWISFSGGDERAIADGTPFAECVAALQASARVLAIGINCTGPELTARLLESAALEAGKPFVAYPNTGERFDARSSTWSGEANADWAASHFGRYRAAGARVVGGCCRTTPGTIRELRRLADA